MRIFFLAILLIGCTAPGDTCFCPDDIDTYDATTVLQLDTVVLFDPADFSRTCFVTSFYSDRDADADSIVIRAAGAKTIRCGWIDDCWQLISIKSPVDCALVDWQGN